MKTLLTLLIVTVLANIAHASPGDRVWFVSDAAFRAYTSGIRSTSTFPRIADSLPTQFDVVMLAGIRYVLDLTHVDGVGSPINLTGASMYAQYRSAPAPGGTIFATYSTPIVSAAGGTSRVTLSPAQTTSLSGTTGMWDLLYINSAGAKKYRISGKARVQPVATVGP